MSYSSSSETEDDIGAELTPELDYSVNRTLEKVLNENEKTSYQEELKQINDSEKKKDEIISENEKVLEKISKDDDETDKFLKNYFGKREFSKLSEVTLRDNSSDDIDDFDEALEFEENFNMRFSEPRDSDNEDVQTHPRFVGTEAESARRRRRRIQREQAHQNDNITKQKFKEIEEKYKAMALANNGHLTDQQLSDWVDEIAKIEIELQGGTFQYHEVVPEGNALDYLKDDQDSPSSGDDSDENEDSDHESTKSSKKKPKWRKINEDENGEMDDNQNYDRREGERRPPRGTFRGGHGSFRDRRSGDFGFRGRNHPRGHGRNDFHRGRQFVDPYTAHRK